MSTAQSSKEEPIIYDDTWVELTMPQDAGVVTPRMGTPPLLPVIGSDQAENKDAGATIPWMGTPPLLPVISSSHLEKLLLDAQRESRGPSGNPSGNPSNAPSSSSSRGSPKSMNSPNGDWTTVEVQKMGEDNRMELLRSMEWIWDWSSRPEAHPRSMSTSHFQHKKRSLLSVRNTSVMKSPLLTVRNVTTLVITHACTFILGAAAMLIYLKKYCHWAATSVSSTPVYASFQFD